MSKNDLDEILANAKKIPTVEDLLPKSKKKKKHTLLSKATRKKPKKKKVEEPTLQENFLKQIQDYNDFIIQNDLNVEQIDPLNDYDFTAFKSPEDWAVESERLADRLSDRKMEIQQNEDAEEFEGMELENGVPSFESVKDMSPEQFKAYEEKYLSDTFKKIDEQIKVDEARPEFEDELKEEITRQNYQRNGEPFVRKEPVVEVEVTEPKVKPKVKKVVNKPSQLDLKSLAVNSLPYPVKSALDSAIEAIQSGNRVINQGQPVNALQDAGRGVMSGLAETTADVLDIGGLIKNAIADKAHKSAHWWEDGYKIPDSESGRLGSNLGTDLVLGAVGGSVGKGLGSAYKGLREGGEVLRKRATVAAKNAEQMVMSNPALKNKLKHQTQLVRQNVYENLTRKSPYKSINSNESLASVLSHNIKRNFDSRAMLQRNDREIEDLFNQGTPLDDALKIQQNRWNRIPDISRDAGVILPVAVGQ